MKLYYMKQKALDSLKKNISDNLDNYQSDSLWIDQYFIDKEAPNFWFDTGIEVDDYELILGDSETDFSNSKIIFEVYKDKLNLVQASDLRLWAYLTHVQHWDYMRTRWKIDAPDENDEPEDEKKSPREKAVERVKARYFFGTSRGKGFVRQGIARLYWCAYLTYDENNDNPYEYTEFLFSKQDILASITERSYARNKVLVLAALKELKKYPLISREDTRLFLAKLNQAGAITVLDFLNPEQACRLCEKVMDEVNQIPCLKEGSTFKAYNKVTGKEYEHVLVIEKGHAVIPGKWLTKKRVLDTKPKNLLDKREGSKISISDKDYIIRGIS